MSKQQQPRKPARPFTPPPAFKGMPCYWFAEPGEEPMGALIAEVGQQAVTLAVVVPGTSNFLTRDGVRHASDPACARPEARANGVWDYSPVYSRADAMDAHAMSSPPAEKENPPAGGN